MQALITQGLVSWDTSSQSTYRQLLANAPTHLQPMQSMTFRESMIKEFLWAGIKLEDLSRQEEHIMNIAEIFLNLPSHGLLRNRYVSLDTRLWTELNFFGGALNRMLPGP